MGACAAAAARALRRERAEQVADAPSGMRTPRPERASVLAAQHATHSSARAAARAVFVCAARGVDRPMAVAVEPAAAAAA